jgi:hypothetical protein
MLGPGFTSGKANFFVDIHRWRLGGTTRQAPRLSRLSAGSSAPACYDKLMLAYRGCMRTLILRSGNL